jgi:hypothetical protein
VVAPGTTEEDPPPTETGVGYAWADGAPLAFNGTYTHDGYRYAMTFNLQRSGGSVSGTIFVVCETAPADQSALVGRSAMEWVGGSYATSGALSLTGRNSTDTSVWETGTYRLTLASSGTVSGRATGDGGRITGSI